MYASRLRAPDPSDCSTLQTLHKSLRPHMSLRCGACASWEARVVAALRHDAWLLYASRLEVAAACSLQYEIQQVDALVEVESYADLP